MAIHEITGGKIINRKANAKADVEIAPLGPEAQTVVDDVVQTLTGIHTDNVMAKDTAQADFARAMASAEETKLDALRLVAAELPELTAEYWDNYLRKPFSDALMVAGLKMPGPVVSMYKVALLALVNGIEPNDEYARDVNKFVNKQARAELVKAGKLEDSKVGRKAGTTSNKTKSAAREAAIVLARHGDANLSAEVVNRRAAMLEALATAGNWKLLEAKLREACKVLKIEIA